MNDEPASNEPMGSGPALRLSGRQIGLLVALLILLVGAVWLGTRSIGGGSDWFITQRPATLLLLQGRSPYELNQEAGYWSISYFYNPPWTLIPLIPFALPPQIGLFLVLVKPQMGLMVALFWFIQSLRHGRMRETARVFWPVTLATLLSFALFGLWPLEALRNAPVGESFNTSAWPLSIPFGIVAMLAAFKTERVEYAMAAGPCFTTYITFHSWVGALAALAKSRDYMLAAIIGTWIIGLVRVLGY